MTYGTALAGCVLAAGALVIAGCGGTAVPEETVLAKVGDQEIRKGDKVVMYYGAANRDPRVFENPEVFDITRKPNPHLALGSGTHFCMGSHIARLEMRVTLEEFFRRFPNVSLKGPPERMASNFISSITRLPIGLV